MNNITYAIIGCYVDKGMKSKGSKFLFNFNSQKLLDFQIKQIKDSNKNNKNYEIIVITNFETQKIQKLFGNQIKVIDTEIDTNPIIKICQLSLYKNIFFIDYGCVYTKKIIDKIPINKSFIVSTLTHKNNKLDIGITVDYNDNVEHLFFDLPDKKFTNMFFLKNDVVEFLLKQKTVHRNNLMYFEILNYVLDNGFKIKNQLINNDMFIYFNHMRQKNGINKFITKNSN